ncbi:hypothetical protein [Burkholderia vietnamiensis]|uniref:hypothetical protein n=1 Tax=Burkholderia vietnamiensis TaxID=60552 RepID=UPI0012DA242D|nr:hypothetical protein [Burkholderia vietnamiensis]MCA8072092.1 hypothetical protein [Burkholderia vietnamiensis]
MVLILQVIGSAAPLGNRRTSVQQMSRLSPPSFPAASNSSRVRFIAHVISAGEKSH